MPVQLEAAAERARARIGTVLKQKWHLDQLLGVGGMAAVYAATHRNKKRAAIKMLHPELSQDAAIRQRFLRETYVANSVGQQGAVAVDYDDVSDDGLAFLVMELLDGETIEQRWERKGRSLPPQEALSVVDQLLDTLTAAHARGIVHRDLKPENVFLTRDGTVKVLDFGIARVRELSTPMTTLAGSAMGTPSFMSPEQARGRWEDVDGRSDLWAVGATLYTLLTGKFVHSGQTPHDTLALAATRPARSLAERRPDLHPSLIRFVDRALSYDRGARFQDAATMQHALRVTFVEMQGGEAATQFAIADLQSMPTARAITLRNLRPPQVTRPAPGPDFAAAQRATPKDNAASPPGSAVAPRSGAIVPSALLFSLPRGWPAAAAIGALLVTVLVWWAARGHAEAGAGLPVIPNATGRALSHPSTSSARPDPEPKKAIIKLDDLPQERREAKPSR